MLLVRTLFCSKGSEMAQHATSITETIPWFKAVESMWFDSSVGWMRPCMLDDDFEQTDVEPLHVEEHRSWYLVSTLKTFQEWMKAKQCYLAFCQGWKGHTWRQSHTFLDLDSNCFQLTLVFMQSADFPLRDEIVGTSSCSVWESEQRMWSRQLFVHIWRMSGQIHIVIGSFHVCYVYRGGRALEV